MGAIHGKQPWDNSNLRTGDFYGLDAAGVHGDADDFMGRSLKAKYSPGGVPPAWPCKGTPILASLLKLRCTLDVTDVGPTLLGKLLLRSTIAIAAPPPFESTLLLSSNLVAPFETPPTFAAMLLLSSELAAPFPGPPLFASMLLLSSELTAPFETPPTFASMLLLSSELTAPFETPPTFESMLLLSSELAAPFPGPPLFESMLLLRSELTAPFETPPTFASMLLLSSELTAPFETPPTFASMLLLSSELTAPFPGPPLFASMLLLQTILDAPGEAPTVESDLLLESELIFPIGSGSGSGSFPGGPGPGPTCETALMMDSGVDYTLDVVTGDPDQWVKFWLPGDFGADIAYRTNSGADRSISWYHGACDDLHLIRGTFEPLVTFPYAASGTDEWIIGFINNFNGTGNYTVRITAT